MKREQLCTGPGEEEELKADEAPKKKLKVEPSQEKGINGESTKQGRSAQQQDGSAKVKKKTRDPATNAELDAIRCRFVHTLPDSALKIFRHPLK